MKNAKILPDKEQKFTCLSEGIGKLLLKRHLVLKIKGRLWKDEKSLKHQVLLEKIVQSSQRNREIRDKKLIFHEEFFRCFKIKRNSCSTIILSSLRL